MTLLPLARDAHYTYTLKIIILSRLTASSLSDSIDPYLKILKYFSVYLEFSNLLWVWLDWDALKSGYLI